MSGYPDYLSGRSRRPLFLVSAEPACQYPLVDSITVTATAPGEYSLWLEAGTTDVDDVISELGHEPNGYFWEGIVELLVSTQALPLRRASRPIRKPAHSSRTAGIEGRSTT